MWVCDARGTEALLRQRRFAFHYVQLLPAPATAEDGARAGHLRERVEEIARGDGFSTPWLCGDAGARPSLDERAETRHALDGAAGVKLRVARKLRKHGRPGCAGQIRLPFAEMGEPVRAFWQARFYDFNVYSTGKKKEKLHYMHANPVVRGLVKHPRDWAWSSWGFYFGETAGLVTIDAEE